MKLYAVLSLTIVRIAAVAISLIGTRLKLETFLFLGWFGPKGIASILFGLLVVERSELASQGMILATVVITVLISVFVRGLTALPGAKWYAARAQTLEPKALAPEFLPVSDIPVRLPYK